jgi:hypothetical protein
MRILLAILLCCVSAFAQTLNVGTANVSTLTKREPTAGGSCPAVGSPSAEQASNDGANYGVGLFAASYYVGQSMWTDASARTICRVGFMLSLGGGSISSQTFTAKIWSDSDYSLGSVLATSNGVLGTNTWSSTWVYFDFPTPYTTTGGANYHITIDHGGQDGSNYAVVRDNSASTGFPGNIDTWTSAKAWQVGVNPAEIAIRIYWQ